MDKKQAVLSCLEMVKVGLIDMDKECIRNYWEQANDLVCDIVKE